MYRRSVASTSQTPPPEERVTFSSKDTPEHEDPFCDALVIQAAVEGFTVSRILIDNGSSVKVIFKKAFEGMKVEPRRIVASDGPLFGFSGERKEVEGGVGLQVKLGGTSRNCRFVIVDAPSSYNAIFRRPLISAFQCVPSSFHQCLKFNSDGIQVRIKGDSRMARQCYVMAVNTISWLAKAEEMEKIMESLSRVEVAKSSTEAAEAATNSPADVRYSAEEAGEVDVESCATAGAGATLIAGMIFFAGRYLLSGGSFFASGSLLAEGSSFAPPDCGGSKRPSPTVL
ncbi:hypothetical protein KSP39_PZI012028 [Platanthera zijinensis]|uniref:Uncharacterized protein n=1 Tax=Platanthera zijinensis TaxID=2320716 RepID=A0AAP0BF07_9ASPA